MKEKKINKILFFLISFNFKIFICIYIIYEEEEGF